MPLLGGLKKPLLGFFVVLRNSLSVIVTNPEAVLRLGMTLLGSLKKPLCRFSIVLRDAFFVIVANPEAVLRLGMTLLGGFKETLAASRSRRTLLRCSNKPRARIATGMTLSAALRNHFAASSWSR